MTEPTDAEIVALADATRTAEGGASGYILPISFARAVLAKWGTPATKTNQCGEICERAKLCAICARGLESTPAAVGVEPLSDEKVDSLCKVGPVYATEGKVTRTPTQYRDELEAAQRYGLRKGERAHGIKKGGQHG